MFLIFQVQEVSVYRANKSKFVSFNVTQAPDKVIPATDGV